jgi:DNA-binding NarL/FixJ family response regulator
MAEPMGGVALRQPAQQPLRIVVGENNADLALTVALLLDEEADMHCVATVSSASEVLQALEAHAPNAFVLDLSLDDGSSMPLISTLRARQPRAAIVIFTGHKNTLLEQYCLQAGADAVVVKSGEIDELKRALRRAASQFAVP